MGRVNFPGNIIVLHTDPRFYRTIAEKCRMLSRAVNNPLDVHVKNDVGGISVDDKITGN